MTLMTSRKTAWVWVLAYLVLYVGAFGISTLERVPDIFWLVFFYLSAVHISTYFAITAYHLFVQGQKLYSVTTLLAALAMAFLGWSGVLGLILS